MKIRDRILTGLFITAPVIVAVAATAQAPKIAGIDAYTFNVSIWRDPEFGCEYIKPQNPSASFTERKDRSGKQVCR